MAKANTKKTTPTVNHPTTPEEKKKALDTAMEQIIKNYGQGAVMFLGGEGNKKLDVESVPTGSIGLDYALGIGGLPKGRIIEIYGPESGGKTTVTLHAIAETQKLGGMAAFIDVEHALDPVYAKSLGVDIDRLIVSQPDTGEQALEIMETLARSGAIDIVVLDSVAAMVTKAEIDGEIGDSFVGVQARLMSAAMRKQSLKKYNDQVLDSEKSILGRLRAELAEMQSELDAKVAEYEQSIDKLNELVRGGTTAMRLSLHKKYVSSLQQDIYRIKGLMAHKREEIENQLQKVIDATKEVSKLEKLEEKQLEEYRYASQKEQEQIIEEFVTNGSSNGGNTP